MPNAPEFLNDGRYRIDKVLGVGGMSVVLLAFDTRMQVPRAIKLLHKRFTRNPQVRERFENEATAQAGLRHPNILMVHDVVDDPMGVYLVMELAEGGSLADQVKATGPLSPALVAQIGITVGRALGAAHAEGVVHRDIKPENILRDRHGHLKVADFGIARVLVRNANLTQTGMVMGTWAYMPPEQRESARQVDGRADIYALGASLFYLLTARQPSALHNPETHSREYDGVPEALARVVQKATRLYPEDRYQTCEELAQDLERILPELTDEPMPGFVPPEGPGATLTPALADLSTFMENNADAAETLAPFFPDLVEGETPAGGTAIPTLDEPSPLARSGGMPNLADLSPVGQAPTLIQPAPAPTPTVITSPEPSRPAGIAGSQLIIFIAGVLAAIVAVAVLLPRLITPPSAGPSPTPTAAELDTLAATPPAPSTAPPTPSPVEPTEASTSSPPTADAPKGSSSEATPPTAASSDSSTSTAGTSTSSAAGSSSSTASSSPTSTAPRIITVASDPNAGSSTGTAASSSVVQDPTGTVVVRTVPSGATVSLKGQTLSKVGRGYQLATGSHVLDVKSPDGESTRIPVVVRRDQTIEVCYSFDTNSACEDQ